MVYEIIKYDFKYIQIKLCLTGILYASLKLCMEVQNFSVTSFNSKFQQKVCMMLSTFLKPCNER